MSKNGRRDDVESLTTLEEGEFKVPIDGCINVISVNKEMIILFKQLLFLLLNFFVNLTKEKSFYLTLRFQLDKSQMKMYACKRLLVGTTLKPLKLTFLSLYIITIMVVSIFRYFKKNLF